MNKEVKELIEQLEEYASGGGSGLYPFEESVKALLDYINQLETNNFKLQARSDRYKQKIIQLEKQLEHYKSKEIERINKDLLQAENDYLERCIKANISGDING